jgi:hypothetical protein
MRMHLKRDHEQAWEGEKSNLFTSVNVQTFFRNGGLQRYFIVELGEGENGEKLD